MLIYVTVTAHIAGLTKRVLGMIDAVAMEQRQDKRRRVVVMRQVVAISKKNNSGTMSSVYLVQLM